MGRCWAGVVMVLFLPVTAAFGGWEAVQRIQPDERVKVTTRAGGRVDGRFVVADGSRLVVRSKSGEESIGREDIVAVRVADPSRRRRRGLIGTAIGAGIGLGIGLPVCERMANEGRDRGSCVAAIALPAAGGGAALGFLPTPYRLVYEGDRPGR